MDCHLNEKEIQKNTKNTIGNKRNILNKDVSGDGHIESSQENGNYPCSKIDKQNASDEISDSNKHNNISSQINSLSNFDSENESHARKDKKTNSLSCTKCGVVKAKQNLLKCYICKLLKCKDCKVKETHTQMKKRDNASYICEICYDSKNDKHRKKVSSLDENIEKNRRLIGKKRSYNNTRISKHIEEANNDALLDLDLLHECVSPPTELSERKIERVTKNKKIKRPIIYNSYYRCHACSRVSKADCTKCDQPSCNVYFCSKCIRKYDQLFSTCFVCLGLCKCEVCEIDKQTAKQISTKNILKIDNFEIIEDIEDHPWSRYECDEVTYNKMMSHRRNVEGYRPHGGKINKICLICNIDRLTDCGMFKYRSLEEFLYYCKYFYGQDDVLYNSDYRKSYDSFQKIFIDFQKYYHCDYNFKSIKFICKECFYDTLKSEKGFNDIYNSLHIGTNAQSKLVRKKESDDRQNNIIINMNDRSIDDIRSVVSNQSNLSSPNINNFHNMNQSSIQKETNQNNKNLNKIMEIFNTSRPFPDSNAKNLSSNHLNQVNAIILNQSIHDISQTSKNIHEDNDINYASNVSSNDQNKGNATGNTVLEDLKKQFFSIQYYSLLQKLFISYVFKNLEIFLEQISKSQSMGEKVIVNMINSVPQLEGLDPNVANQLMSSISEQMMILRNINKFGYELTTELNNNFDQLKNNGIRLFKTMDPNIRNNLTTNLQNTIDENLGQSNISDLLKNLSNSINPPNNSYDSFIKSDGAKNKQNTPYNNSVPNVSNFSSMSGNSNSLLNNIHKNLQNINIPNVIPNVSNIQNIPNMNLQNMSNFLNLNNMGPQINNMANLNNMFIQNLPKTSYTPLNNSNDNKAFLNNTNSKQMSMSPNVNIFNNTIPQAIPPIYNFNDINNTTRFNQNFNQMNMNKMGINSIPGFPINQPKQDNMNLFMQGNFNQMMGIPNPIFLQSMGMMPGMMDDQLHQQMMNNIQNKMFEEQNMNKRPEDKVNDEIMRENGNN